jgi:predicted small lipoprotein YifL
MICRLPQYFTGVFLAKGLGWRASQRYNSYNLHLIERHPSTGLVLSDDVGAAQYCRTWMHTMRHLLLISALALVLNGCGQKGPLTLPDSSAASTPVVTSYQL